MRIKKYDFAVMGGDMRMVYTAESLGEMGYHVCTCELCVENRETERSLKTQSLENVAKEVDVLILPIPVTKNQKELYCEREETKILLTDILDEMHENQILFAGCIPEEVERKARIKGIRCYDFMKDECLAVYNSIATAEGAVAEAITRSPQNLNKSRCMVLGYGKCGKTLAAYLKGLFCHVTVCARREEVRQEAAVTVDHVCDFEHLEKELGECQFIFNTVPELILDREKLKMVNEKVCIIDIASAPYGVDFKAAGEMGINASLCSGLPGKYAPGASAQAMALMVTERIYGEGEK